MPNHAEKPDGCFANSFRTYSEKEPTQASSLERSLPTSKLGTSEVQQSVVFCGMRWRPNASSAGWSSLEGKQRTRETESAEVPLEPIYMHPHPRTIRSSMATWSYTITSQCAKKLTFRVRRRRVRDKSALVALDNRANACRQTMSCREDMQSHHRRGNRRHVGR